MLVTIATEFKSNLRYNSALTKSMEPAEIYQLRNKQKLITDEDIARGISADELLNRVRPRIKMLFEK